MTRAAPSAADRYIGKRIRMLRLAHDKTQAQLAGELGVTFQQIQKYEKGINRISAVNLLLIAHYFDRDIHWFLPGDNEAELDPDMLRIGACMQQIQEPVLRCIAVRQLEMLASIADTLPITELRTGQ